MEKSKEFYSEQLKKNLEGFNIASSTLKTYETGTNVEYFLDKEGFIHSNSQSYSIVETNPMTTDQFRKKVNQENGILFSIEFDQVKFFRLLSDIHLGLSNMWGKELSTRTDLSKSMTNTSIDEKQSNHFRLHELAEKNYNLVVVEKLDALYNFKKNSELSPEEKLDVFYRDIDLFDHYKQMPEELDIITSKWARKQEDEGLEYADCEDFLNECKSIGYTFEYYLDAEPFLLRPIDFEKQMEVYNTLKEVNHSNEKLNNKEIIGGKIKDIAAEASKNLEYLNQFDNNTQNIVKKFQESIDPDMNPLTSFGRDSQFIDDVFEDIENGTGELWKKNNKKDSAQDSHEYLQEFIGDIYDEMRNGPKDRFQEENITNESYFYFEKGVTEVPDFLLDNKLSEFQVSALLAGENVDFIDPQQDDELKIRFNLQKDGRISGFYPSGEEFFLKSGDVAFMSKDQFIEELVDQIKINTSILIEGHEFFVDSITEKGEYMIKGSVKGDTATMKLNKDDLIKYYEDGLIMISEEENEENININNPNQKIMSEIKKNQKKDPNVNDVERYNELGQRSVAENGLSPLTKEEQSELDILHEKLHNEKAPVTNQNVKDIENKTEPEKVFKKWEINPAKSSDFYVQDLNEVLKIKNRAFLYNFISRNFGKDVAETIRKNDFRKVNENDTLFKDQIYPKAKSIESIKPQFYFFHKEQKTAEWREVLQNHEFGKLNGEGKISLAHVDYLMENLSKDDMLKMLQELNPDQTILSMYNQVFEKNFEDLLNFPLSDKKLEVEFKEERYNLVNTVNKSDNNKEVFLEVGQEYLDNAQQKKNDQELTK